MTVPLRVTVNGRPRQHDVPPRLLLVDFLREVLDLTGTHVGCETSICGACTVLVDGRSVKSCTMLAAQADGAGITTIEGLADGEGAQAADGAGTSGSAVAGGDPAASGGATAATGTGGGPPAGDLDDPEALHPLQRAFWEEHGLQCGFCTPGMILAARELLAENPDPDEDEIREGLEGNLCRCTGYHNIVEAVRSAADEMGG